MKREETIRHADMRNVTGRRRKSTMEGRNYDNK